MRPTNASNILREKIRKLISGCEFGENAFRVWDNRLMFLGWYVVIASMFSDVLKITLIYSYLYAGNTQIVFTIQSWQVKIISYKIIVNYTPKT